LYLLAISLLRPERWAKDSPEIDVLHKLSMPFSAGPRMCTGWRLAEAEMRLTLASIIRRFSFEYEDIDAVQVVDKYHLQTRNDWVRIKRWEQ
jgi:cytochrome P450